MKKEIKNTMSLKKLTIARINEDGMKRVHGGDCIPTEHERNSHVVCRSTQHPF